MPLTVFAVHAHPDDIEFVMSGTLFLLAEQGCDIHYMNIANGCCGSMEHTREETAALRAEEARAAAACLGATFHPSMVNDLEVFYDHPSLQHLAAIMREVAPDIVLTASPQDYMEDHMNACRLAVSTAFVMGMPNYLTDPPRKAVGKDVAIYHAMPHGLRDGLCNPIYPDFYVDVGSVLDKKEAMLACHASQKDWLDRTQGFDSYLEAMKSMTADMGSMSGRFTYAEGWRRHLHLGYSRKPWDPIGELLGDIIQQQGNRK